MGDRSQRQPLRPAAAWLFLGGGLAAAGLYTAGPAFWSPLVLIVPVVALLMVVAGARRNTAAPQRRPWYALAASLGCFTGAAVLRLLVPGAAASPPSPAAAVPDLLTVPGYVLFGYTLLSMLRRRGGTRDRSASADAVFIGLAAALALWVFLLAPAVGAATIPTWPQLAIAVFPLVDVFLLGLIIRLIAAGGVRPPSLWLLTAATGAVLSLDTVYVLLEKSAIPGPWLTQIANMLLLPGYVAAAAAALHPSMRTLTEPQQVITRALGPVRVAGILVVLVSPAVVAYLVPAPDLGNAIVRVVLTAVLAITLVVRTVQAHNALARAERDALHRSTHDELTDLANRELLAETIGSRSGEAISLLFLDLDRFKKVNDTWGHRVGDELLCAVADRLTRLARSTDVVCRVGGDEFVIAITHIRGMGDATSLARCVVQELGQPFSLSVGDVVVTSSVGIVHASGAIDPLDLIRDADIAMYRAKDAGGNCWALYDSSQREGLAAKVALEQALRGALGRGELSVHYQPIVELADDTLTGFEALMRWRHPRLGVVSPADFIPIAEETGLILSSGIWLLNESLDQLARWRSHRSPGLPELHVSVNLSPRQLRDPLLVQEITAALDRTGLPPSALWLEITESVMIADPHRAVTTLQALHDLGVTLCIDDFGTGYASVSYLRQLPADIVKIDRSFITDVTGEPRDAAILTSVITMAHALGQRVVAEGVETIAQRDWLREHGCDLLQGYLYGKPRPADNENSWSDQHLAPAAATQPAAA